MIFCFRFRDPPELRAAVPSGDDKDKIADDGCTYVAGLIVYLCSKQPSPALQTTSVTLTSLFLFSLLLRRITAAIFDFTDEAHKSDESNTGCDEDGYEG